MQYLYNRTSFLINFENKYATLENFDKCDELNAPRRMHRAECTAPNAPRRRGCFWVGGRWLKMTSADTLKSAQSSIRQWLVGGCTECGSEKTENMRAPNLSAFTTRRESSSVVAHSDYPRGEMQKCNEV